MSDHRAAVMVVLRGRTSGPGWNREGEVRLREEQQDAGGHGAKGEAIRPAIAQAAHGV